MNGVALEPDPLEANAFDEHLRWTTPVGSFVGWRYVDTSVARTRGAVDVRHCPSAPERRQAQPGW